jgi:flagellum-specific ATP synthase
VTTPDERAAITELRSLMAAYRDAKDLVEIGAYVPGTNPVVDRAIALRDGIDAFLRQPIHDVADAGDSWSRLQGLMGS